MLPKDSPFIEQTKIWYLRPYVVKTFKNLFLQIQLSDGLETWYLVSITLLLTRLSKW